MTHVFAFDIVPVSIRSDLPGWLHEGLAEFQRGEWSDADRRLIRELAPTSAVPSVTVLRGRQSMDAAPVRIVGRLAIDFLAGRAGDDGVRELLGALRENRDSVVDAYLAAAGLTESEFDREFERFIRARHGV